MIKTAAGKPVNEKLLYNYFKRLVNHFFKILPMREDAEVNSVTGRADTDTIPPTAWQEETSLPVYMKHLQLELFGCQRFVPELATNAAFMSLLSILQYLIDNPDCPVRIVKREVFNAITLCNQLKASYFDGG